MQYEDGLNHVHERKKQNKEFINKQEQIGDMKQAEDHTSKCKKI